MSNRQDLNGALLSDSARIFDHTTFSEMDWSRDQLREDDYALPPGLASSRDLFTEEIITVLEDIHAFQRMRDSQECDPQDYETMIRIDNGQAWNESRLFNIGHMTDNLGFLVKCCLTVAYLCSYALYSEIWSGTFITSRLSSRLLLQLEEAEGDPQWSTNPKLVLWLVYIGAAFSEDREARSGFVNLLQTLQSESAETCDAKNWKQTLQTLRLFIWSDKVFYSRCWSVWRETQAIVCS